MREVAWTMDVLGESAAAALSNAHRDRIFLAIQKPIRVASNTGGKSKISDIAVPIGPRSIEK
ncbi:hypothetical protein AC630_23645 [Bradyrhizobium sp. AS23.2]|nr:hypothetical protein AC630_23645 [Bradyrhizobium sp. AS23.2]